MIIEDMSVRTNITSWWCFEAHIKDKATEYAEDISLLNWFEPHFRSWIVLLVNFLDVRIEWCKSMSVKVARNGVHWMIKRIPHERLIEWVITDHVWIECKFVADFVPVCNKLISQPELVIVHCIEPVD